MLPNIISYTDTDNTTHYADYMSIYLRVHGYKYFVHVKLLLFLHYVHRLYTLVHVHVQLCTCMLYNIIITITLCLYIIS